MTNQYDTIIIGAGLSGLVVAHKLKRANSTHRLAILEKSQSAGGAIRSFEASGFRAELGPHGFLDNCRESKDLLRETGLTVKA